MVNRHQRSRSPANRRQGSRSPANQRQRSRSPANMPQRSRSPASLPQRSRSPANIPQRSRSPANIPQRGRSPENIPQISRSPGSSRHGSRSPGSSRQGSRSPGSSRQGSRSPESSRQGSRSPANRPQGFQPVEIAFHGLRIPGGSSHVRSAKSPPKKRKSRPVPRSVRAGLQFPVGRVHRYLRDTVPRKQRVSSSAAIYLAAVMEYMTAEVIELSGKASKDLKTRRITPRHVMLAIRGDDELDCFIKATIAGGGVIPNIHKVLKERKKKKKRV